MKKVFMSVAVMAMAAVMASCCGGNANNSEQKCKEKCDSTKCEQKCDSAATCKEKAECADTLTAADLTKKYICPARCESSDKAGNCSKCGMELVENN